VAERDEEGFYRIAGRLKELVISGGENVYPAEVESVLHDHPAVAEAAVVGVPDERWGEVCAAFVVLREGTTATGDELRAHCAERLARFKVPRSVAVVGELPRSALGKVLKDELRETATGVAS
jgi:fatty-acyl-CoA synthase